MRNEEWSENILKKIDPLFKHRWVVYNELLTRSLKNDMVWLDCGSGNNGSIEDLGHLCKMPIGIDVVNPIYKNHYINADILKLPFRPEFADLITLRFVVEHFNSIDQYINEIGRVVKSGGKIIILTTNILSPFIFLPKLFFPYSIKSRILSKIFKVNNEDVFPTHHHLNSPKKFEELKSEYLITELRFISDLNYTRKLVFILLLIWHMITKLKILNKFRTNILVVLEKI